jgi:hypothetical protein
VEPARGEFSLNADPDVQLLLLDLQEVDSRLDQLAHRRDTLPEAKRLTELEAESAAVADRLVAAETEAGDVQRLVDKAESDVEQVRQRAQRDQQRLDAGVGTAKDLQSLTAEIQSLARRQSELEDAELEVMERLEEVQSAVQGLQADRDRLTQEISETTQARDVAFERIAAESQDLAEERAALVARVPADLLALYDKLRGQYDGVGAAALEHGRCGGCRLELNQVDLNEIRSQPPEAVVRCEECRRILVRR